MAKKVKGSEFMAKRMHNDPYARKRKRYRRYRMLTVITFAVLSIYLLGYLVAFLSKPSVSVEAVNYGTIDVPTALHGIIIRDEVVVKSTTGGTPSYQYSEGERVSKDSVVCTVKDTGDSEVLEQKIREIDEDILKAQQSKVDFSLFKEDLDRISRTISEAFDSTAYKFISGNFGDVYSLKNSVQTQIDLRNQIWLTENTQSSSALSSERSSYQNELNAITSSYKAPASGVLSLRVDNMEEILTPESIESIAPEQTKMTVQPEYISKVIDVAAEAPLFRIVESNIWYVASYIPNDVAASFNVGDTVTIYTTYDDEELETVAKVHTLQTGENETYAVFECNENMVDFMDIRTMEFKIRQDAYTGFKIPNEAIVEKVFLKIPKDCVMESLGEKNVIVRQGEQDTLVPIRVSSSDDTNYLVLQDFNSLLKIGTVIVKGGEDSTETYTISEVATLKGVYVANSSVAQFTVINILASNSEYSIVDSQDQYGLKVYDNIVSDAKSIEDAETIS